MMHQGPTNSQTLVTVGTLSALLAGGCGGRIGEAEVPTDQPEARAGELGAPPPATTTATTAAAFKPAPGGLRRLTRSQYQNAIRDLLGDGLAVPSGLDPDTVLSGFASIGAALTTFSATATEKIEGIALALAEQALADPARRTRLVPCTPRGTVDDACARTFVAGFGRRAWRRPLAEDEIARYVAVARQGAETLSDFWHGLGYALAGLLQSPHFLYRVELGTPGPTAGVRGFDDWELATRLSFFLWNTTPDDALLAAAQAGALRKPDGLRREAQRLLGSPRARAAFRELTQELLRLDALDDLEQSPTAFPLATRTIGPAMREEALRLVDEVLFSPGGDFRRVFDASFTFVNRELARLYGLPAPAGTGFERATMPADGLRLGLLGQGAFLAPNAHETTTSPTRRGKFVREVLLCHEIPNPPPDVNATLPEDPKGSAPRTMREKLTAHNVPGCAACHARMDFIGLGFENFDAIGKLRTMEAGKPIDASGDLDGAPFRDPRELAAILRKHADVDECLTRNVFRYAMAHVETPGEEPVIKRIVAGLAAAPEKLPALLLGVADSEAFRLAADGP